MASKGGQIDIGFVEECEDWKLHSRFFPSKVGGKPAWLNLKDLPKPSDVLCGKCSEPCIFLCQIYAPGNDEPESFHRSLFVFTCKNGSCCRTNNADNFLVFRCQLKRDNEYYPFEPPVEKKDELLQDSKWAALCNVCGAKGPNHCAKCKKVNYCSRTHQIIDWKNGHKEQCNNEEAVTATEVKTNLLFPEWELVIDEEGEELPRKTSEEEELKYLNQLIAQKQAGSLMNENETELEQYANKDVEDETFEKFKDRINRDPGQVLRYNRGGIPLWIAAQPTPSEEEIPNCPDCNSKRQFECQIMPQLLNYLNLDLGVNCLDWGVVAIYACSKNCTEGAAYKKEFLFKQDVSQSIASS